MMVTLLYTALEAIVHAAVFTMTAAIICSIVVLGIAICLKIGSILLNKKGEKK